MSDEIDFQDPEYHWRKSEKVIKSKSLKAAYQFGVEEERRRIHLALKDYKYSAQTPHIHDTIPIVKAHQIVEDAPEWDDGVRRCSCD